MFINDPNLWFGKIVFQYHLGLVIHKERLLHAEINPKDILEQVESRYWTEPTLNGGGDSSSRCPGLELFGRINAALDTKDDKTLQVFLDQLSSNIRSIFRDLRYGEAVELDASTPSSPGQISRAVTSSSNTSSNPSSEDGDETTAEEAESQLQENVVQSGALSTHGRFPLAQPPEAEPFMHRYTSLLHEHAARSGEKPEYTQVWVSADIWRCEATFDNTRGIGEARSFKDAKHIASRNICRALGIVD